MSAVDLSKIRWDIQGLVPAVVQDAASKDVLMVAYMNEESLRKTLESGETWFWSRSRQSLWHKGATSSNVQYVQEIRYDCDADTLLILVNPAGSACHTGKYSCFFERLDQADNRPASSAQSLEQPEGRFEILARLESLLAVREAEMPEGAYTTSLFHGGVDKILKKIGEEAGEVIIAAKNRSAKELRYEAADLLFHLLVLLREQKLPLDAVLDELSSRFGKQKQDYESLR